MCYTSGLLVYHLRYLSSMDKIELNNKASAIVGGAVGAALGLLGGPGGALSGYAAGVAIASSMAGAAIGEVIKDVGVRVFSNREKLRVDNATVYIADGIVEKIGAGQIVRQDGFFEGTDNFTSNGAELLEGILLKCKAQYQEKKVRLISNVFKNVAFNPLVSAQSAYQVLALADALTYHKLCLLSYLGRKADFHDFTILSAPFRWYPNVEFSTDTLAVAQDLFEMAGQGIVTNFFSTFDSIDIVPGRMTLTVRGQRAFELLELDLISYEDVLDVIKPLEYLETWGVNSNGTVNAVFD